MIQCEIMVSRAASIIKDNEIIGYNLNIKNQSGSYKTKFKVFITKPLLLGEESKSFFSL